MELAPTAVRLRGKDGVLRGGETLTDVRMELLVAGHVFQQTHRGSLHFILSLLEDLLHLLQASFPLHDGGGHGLRHLSAIGNNQL